MKSNFAKLPSPTVAPRQGRISAAILAASTLFLVAAALVVPWAEAQSPPSAPNAALGTPVFADAGTDSVDGAASIASDGTVEAIRTPSPKLPADANDLVLRAAHGLTRHHSISARLRQRIDLYGQQLLGTGEFWQLNLGGTTYVRYEIKIPVGNQQASIQQVNDGRFLWIRSSVPTPAAPTHLHTTLRRIDVQTVAKAFEAIPDNSPLRDLAVNAGHGGLAEVLIDLYRHFDFQTAYQGNLHGVPVWITTGTILAEKDPMNRSAQSTSDSDEIESSGSVPTPAQQPDAVTIAIGQDDEFPYRIEFYKKKRDESKTPHVIVNKSEIESILLLELFEVTLDGPLDPRRIFVYHPDEIQLVDVTQSYIDRLQRSVR